MSNVLFLAATPLEAARIRSSGVHVVLTGIGAVNTAHALTRQFVTHGTPSLVIQTGIGGAYVPAGVAVGSVVLASSETYGDLGVQTPEGWMPADEIGIPLLEATAARPARFNHFPLDANLVASAGRAAGPLVAATGPFLTMSTVTGIRARGDELHARFGAICESMEGAAAAHVCALHEVPFLEVRGVSNLVEDRNRAAWKIADAADAAQAVALRLAEHL